MKLITDKGIELIEKQLGLICSSSRFDMNLKFIATTELDQKEAELFLTKKEVPFISSSKQLIINQKDLVKLAKPGETDTWFTDERVWFVKQNTLAILTKDMDHQRLSNSVHLLELFLKANKISKDDATDYLNRLGDAIIPELEERFGGEILEYKPFYEWEHKLVREVSEKIV